MAGLFDIYKGAWIALFGVDSATSPTTQNPLVVNTDGSINATVVSEKLATLTPLGYQQITDLSVAVGLSVPAGATIADITFETAPIRYRDDGTNPTASVGMPLYNSQSMRYTGNLATIKFIQQSAGAVANVSYYK